MAVWLEVGDWIESELRGKDEVDKASELEL